MKRRPSIAVVFVGCAVCAALSFALVELLGWREMTSVLSGTFPSENRFWDGLRALCFLVSYFSFVVVAPILVIAAGVMKFFDRVFSRAPGDSAVESAVDSVAE